MYGFNPLAILLGKLVVGYEVFERSEYERERRAQFMSDIGIKT